MSVLAILTWPDPRLTEICAPVAEITPEIERLAEDMLETMYAAPGRGLAGPQVGAMARIFVMDVAWRDGDPDPKVCINPTLEEIGEDRAVGTEGCLSIPGVTAQVCRPTRVRMAWTTLDGTRRVAALDGFAAICAQHELDHLDGVVTLDHLAPEDRAAVLEAYAAP